MRFTAGPACPSCCPSRGSGFAPRKWSEIVGIVAGHELHAYCDHPTHDRYKDGSHPLILAGINLADCLRQLKAEGWLYRRKGEGSEGSGFCLCPACRKKK